MLIELQAAKKEIQDLNQEAAQPLGFKGASNVDVAGRSGRFRRFLRCRDEYAKLLKYFNHSGMTLDSQAVMGLAMFFLLTYCSASYEGLS